MIITGTSYFPSIMDAENYYTPYWNSAKDRDFTRWVRLKIASGEIHIGKPPLKPGETLFIKDNRYHVQSP